MATHLMLSLKKAAASPEEPWSLNTLSFRTTTTTALSGGGSLDSAPYTLSTLRETSDFPVGPDGDNLELAPMP